MLSFIKIPAQIIRFILGIRVSSSEVAAGVCLALFFGFAPLNSAITFFLLALFFFLKFNRFTTLLTLPFFKILYVLGISNFANRIGEFLLIDLDFLSTFWSWFLGLPVISYLDINNTLVAGGLSLSLILCVPVYLVSKTIYIVFVEKHVKNFRDSKLVKTITQYKFINRLILYLERARNYTDDKED